MDEITRLVNLYYAEVHGASISEINRRSQYFNAVRMQFDNAFKLYQRNCYPTGGQANDLRKTREVLKILSKAS